jgi:DNA-3-methyladenine glycosylase I
VTPAGAPGTFTGDGPVVGADGLVRCPWPGDDADYLAYHDHEWGRPVANDQALFEKLVLEGFQAGLSWLTILRKREAFRAAFAGFQPHAVAAFTEADIEACCRDRAIVRNRRKIEAAVTNARALLGLWQQGQALGDLVWAHAPAPRDQRPASMAELPAATAESRALAAALRQAGFVFVGPTAGYAFMQAMGLVDDHLAGCHVPPQACGPRAAAG